MPPPPLSPVPFQLPPAHSLELENGLRVVIFEDSRLPLVSFRLAFRFGDADDPADLVGLTSAVASMLTEGTENYSSRELAEKVERLGASLSASSSDDFTIVAASALDLYASEMLDLIAEVVFRPTFPEKELDLYRRNTLEHLKFQRSQPSFLANEQTSRIVYQDHPYSRISPRAEDIEKLTRERLADFQSRAFVPNNAVLVVVGDIQREELLKEIDGHFGSWESGPIRSRKAPSPEPLTASRLCVVDRPGSAQANIVLSNIGINRDHPDYFPVLVMNQVLGAGASSRVFMNLREEKGYTYGAYTRFEMKKDFGTFEATTEVRSAVTGDSLKEFFYELGRIRDDKVPDDEMDDAKNFLTGVFPIRAETLDGLTNLIVMQELYGLPADYLQTYRSRVAEVTPDQVNDAARKYIHPQNLAVVIVGDAGEIIPQARGYASEIEVFDVDGNRIDPAKYHEVDGAEPHDFKGDWALDLEFQGQVVPVQLNVSQEGTSVSGTLNTALGSGAFSEGSVTGDKFVATAVTDIQGQSIEFLIKGSLSGEIMAGTISAAIIPDSLPFTGRRKA
ncbi:MAG: insulinase family protein [Chloracidobacterium sp.]|nr:insulinase family protein [Chloracidobacterium sp.]